ncbi:MAG: DUF4252 domain-containing protein [Saprospiraceae bacterium]|nr:DUF4252 domain-containing protein [Saprospiraceae bacterium]
MKALLLVLGTLFVYQASAQSNSLDEFFNAHHNSEEVNKIQLGKFALTFAGWFIDDPTARKIAKKSNSARFLITEGKHRVTKSNVERLFKQLDREGFESLINIRDGKDKIELLILEENDSIKNVVGIVSSSDEFLLANFNCNLNKAELESLITQSF